MRLLTAAALSLAMLVVAAPSLLADEAPADPWQKQCAKCHGDDGRGDTPVGRKLGLPSLVGSAWAERSADEICEALRGDKAHAAVAKNLGADAFAAACLRVKEIAGGD